MPVVKCPDCRLVYVTDLQEDIAKHQEVHLRWEAMTHSVFCPSLLAAIHSEVSPFSVTHSSPAWKHAHMYRCARAFKHETRNDYVPWPEEDLKELHIEGQLIGDYKGNVFGAASFKPSLQNYWELNWVWIAPSERGKGHLKLQWTKWMRQYGEILPSPPVSKPMSKFLLGINWSLPSSLSHIDRDVWIRPPADDNDPSTT